MGERLTIGQVSRRIGVPSKTIRFYESEGVIAAPGRTEAGYRLYAPTDIRRLRLAKRARLLGLSLPQVRALVDQAFASECGEFTETVLALIATQREEIHQRIEELEALEAELTELERHVGSANAKANPDSSSLTAASVPSSTRKEVRAHESVSVSVRGMSM